MQTVKCVFRITDAREIADILQDHGVKLFPGTSLYAPADQAGKRETPAESVNTQSAI